MARPQTATQPDADRTPRVPAEALLTPAMRQYAEQKAAVQDAILLFRMGDFYETFYEDARTCSRVLGLTLTSRSKENPVPLAGIPYHALDGYLAKLVRAGFKVAISEQVEDPKAAKGVIRREVVRIVTPGTLTDDALLDERADNYLVGVCIDGAQAGLAVMELSTGQFRTRLIPRGALLDELVRLRPSEVLFADEGIDTTEQWPAALRELTATALVRRSPHNFEAHTALTRLLDHFGVSTLEGFGYAGMDLALRAAGAVIDYLTETQKSAVRHVVSVRPESPETWMKIDRNSWLSLEVDRTMRHGQREGSLLAAIDETVNAMGGRLLRAWLSQPLRCANEIIRRQDAVARLVDESERAHRLRDALCRIADLQRIASRIGVGRASPRDLAALAAGLGESHDIRAQLAGELPSLLSEARDALSALDDLAAYLDGALMTPAPLTVREGNIIAAGFHAELDRLRSIRADGRRYLAEYQAQQIEQTGIASLKVGFNQVFGYYIEVSNTHRDKVPPHYVRKQTVKNAERYITDELKRFETEVLTADERGNELEYCLFTQLCARAVEHLPAILRHAEAIALLDVVAALAVLAQRRRYVRPELVAERILEIRDGRHPVIELQPEMRFVPNDTTMGAADARLLLVTGPNMAGKSTYIRQVALMVLLAQTGSFVPAASMRWGIVDRIFARVGSADEIARGQSTFMVEMVEAANILNNASSDSLVILDEIGRGTSTWDGLSLAWAITEYLHDRVGCRALFATHYHELSELADLLPGVQNLNVAVREWGDQVAFLHRIVAGAADRSYGVHVARLAGVPPTVVERARVLLAELERNFVRESHSPRMAGAYRQSDAQLLLFDDGAAALLADLRALDLDRLTPVDALNTLHALRRKYVDPLPPTT